MACLHANIYFDSRRPPVVCLYRLMRVSASVSATKSADLTANIGSERTQIWSYCAVLKLETVKSLLKGAQSCFLKLDIERERNCAARDFLPFGTKPG